MTEKELKEAIRKVVKNHYLGRKVDFGTSCSDMVSFKVATYKIHSRKSIGIEKYEYDDYGVDEDTERFVWVEFWDSKEKNDVLDCVCCIFTLNKKGQLGTCDAPFNFELEVAYDTAIEMTDQIMKAYEEINIAECDIK